MSFKSLFKTIIKASSLTSFSISSLISLAPEIKAENFNMAACPEPVLLMQLLTILVELFKVNVFILQINMS